MSDVTRIETPLFDRLRALEIATETVRHAPVRTVEEAKAVRGELGGMHIKNLVLRDKKKHTFLVVLPEDATVDLKALREPLNAQGTLSFASASRLEELLGVAPGAVTPFAVLNDPERRVELVLDERLRSAEWINAHPLHNAATTTISLDDLLRFVRDCGHEPRWLSLG